MGLTATDSALLLTDIAASVVQQTNAQASFTRTSPWLLATLHQFALSSSRRFSEDSGNDLTYCCHAQALTTFRSCPQRIPQAVFLVAHVNRGHNASAEHWI